MNSLRGGIVVPHPRQHDAANEGVRQDGIVGASEIAADRSGAARLGRPESKS